MSGSGSKKMIINTRERAVSDDINRLQAFLSEEAAELMYRVSGQRAVGAGQLIGSSIEGGGYTDTRGNDTAAIGTPLLGDVFEGLAVLPQAGSLNLLVQPGVCGLFDPDGQTGSSNPDPASPDDSPYKKVEDPGIQVAGALTIAAGSGSTRVDVIEVQRTTEVLETASRDIFDPATGTVIPATVDKVSAGRLTYRVRQGTPGSGMPANVQGWLPLCVAVVPSSATSVDGMTFWDVRPYVKARTMPLMDAMHATSFKDQMVDRVFANALSVSGKTTLNGIATAQLGIYRAGGILVDGALAPIDIAAADFQETGFAPVAGDFWNLVAVFPRSLPRWVRYLDSPLPRLPLGPNGVLMITGQGPDDDGAYASRTPPTSSGIGANGPAVHLLAGYDKGSTKPGGVVYQDGLVTCAADSIFTLSPTASTLTTDRYDCARNDNFPKNAKSLLVGFNCQLNGTGTNPFNLIIEVDLVDPAGAVTDILYGLSLGSDIGNFTGGIAPIFTRVVEIPIPYKQSTNGLASDTVSIVSKWIDGQGNVASRSLAHMVIFGWRL